MASIYDIDPNKLIEQLSIELTKIKEIEAPGWSIFIKTGAHNERPPEQENWWHIRAAAILRTIYNKGPIGVSKLRSKYGGRKNRGVKPNKFKKGSGKIIRTILQQLDAAGFTKLAEKGKGRIITPKGQSILDNTANKLSGESKKKPAKVEQTKEKPKEIKPKIEEKPKDVPKEAPKIEEKKEEVKKEDKVDIQKIDKKEVAKNTDKSKDLQSLNSSEEKSR